MNAEQWNARYPVGTPVVAYPFVRPEHPVAVRYRAAVAAGLPRKVEDDPCERLVTTTRTPAWELGRGEPVVSVEGYAGGIVLTHVDPICGSQCPAHDHTCLRSPMHQPGICRDLKQKGTESCTWNPARKRVAR